MANDNLRSGPRGSSKQKAKFGVEVITIQVNTSADATFTIPLPFDTTVAVVGCEAHAMTGTTIKDDGNQALTLGRTSDTDAFATFAYGAATAGDFFTKTLGAEADEPFKAANLIDSDTDLIMTYTAATGTGTNEGLIAVRVMLEAVSGGLFSE